MDAIKHLDRYYEFLGMDHGDWNGLDTGEQSECLKTMSHDIIYGLGGEPVIQVGQGTVHYEPGQAQIRVFDGEKCVHVIRLS